MQIDVEQAQLLLQNHVRRTPLLSSPGLTTWLGSDGLVKAESLQHTNSFKARGALHNLLSLDLPRGATVVTYSSGNHGQAVAWAAKRCQVDAIIVMPEDAPSIKVARCRHWGATIEFAGLTSADRRERAQALHAQHAYPIIEPFDHPATIAGQASATLEILQDSEIDALVVPVGGGGLIAGAALAVQSRNANVALVAAEPVGCNSLAQSLAAGERIIISPGPSLADGLRPVAVGELNYEIIKNAVAEAIVVTDEEIREGMRACAAHLGLIVEPSGAASVAAAKRLAGRYQRIACLCSGGNISLSDFFSLCQSHD